MRRLLDAATSALCRLVLRLFFADVQVVGAQRIPRGVPLLIVANHVNNLVDPMLIFGFLGPRPRLLAKSTLWRHPVVAPLLVLAGALPVYRRQDAGAKVARNFETFARCRDALAAGAAVALFPEGTSHSHPHALPLKSGAARIVLEAESACGPLGSAVVPVGLNYEAKDRFGSRVLLLVGEPIDPARLMARYADDARGAVHELTHDIANALGTVTTSFESWDEACRAREAALALAPAGARPFDCWKIERQVRDGLRAVGARPESSPDRTSEVDERPARPLVLLPLAWLGAVLNWLPYKIPAWISDRYTSTWDQPATYKLLAAMLTFPSVWAMEIAVAAWLAGPAGGVAMAVTAPLTGWLALALLTPRSWRTQVPSWPGTVGQSITGAPRDLRSRA